MSPQVICFDLGGVVIRIHRTWQDLARAAGKPIRAVELDGDTRGQIQTILTEYQRGTVALEQMSDRISQAMKGVYDATEIMALHRAQLRDEYEGVELVVTELDAAGLTTAVLSNTGADHWARLVTYPAVSKIRHRFASHEIGALKPEAEAYAALENDLGASGPDILFFDDTEENVHAARERGWRAVRIDPEGPTAEQMREVLAHEGITL